MRLLFTLSFKDLYISLHLYTYQHTQKPWNIEGIYFKSFKGHFNLNDQPEMTT